MTTDQTARIVTALNEYRERHLHGVDAACPACVMLADAAALLTTLQAERAQLATAIATILRGFDEGVFVRSIDNDHDPAWAIKLFPFIQAMAVAQQFTSSD